MKLLPDEKKLGESDDGHLVLTTHRLRYLSKRAGFARLTSIMLEELASCDLTYRSTPMLVAIGVLALLIGAYQGDEWLVIGSVVAFAFVVAYFGSRQQVLVFASAGAEISVPTTAMGFTKCTELIDLVEGAKDARRTGLLERRAAAGA